MQRCHVARCPSLLLSDTTRAGGERGVGSGQVGPSVSFLRRHECFRHSFDKFDIHGNSHLCQGSFSTESLFKRSNRPPRNANNSSGDGSSTETILRENPLCGVD